MNRPTRHLGTNAVSSVAILLLWWSCSPSHELPDASEVRAGSGDADADASLDLGPTPTRLVGGPLGVGVVGDGPPLGDTICVSTHLPTAQDTASQRAADLDLLSELGAAFIRQDFYWHITEPTQGTFEFGAYDTLVDEAADRGIGAIALLAYGNPWATSATDDDVYFPPDDPATFATWAAELAEHFRGRVDRFEIWNEPNSGVRFFKPDADPTRYAMLVGASADAIRQVRPDAAVAPGGPVFHGARLLNTPDATDFLAEMAATLGEGGGLIDALAVHPYPLYPPRSPPESSDDGEVPLEEQIQLQRDALRIDDTVGLWVTEFGWPAWGTVDASAQRDYTLRALLIAYSMGSEVNCVYTLRDEPDALPAVEGRFGLVDADGARRPAFHAIASLGRLGDRVFTRRLELPEFPTVRGLALGTGGREDTAILWTTDGTRIHLVLPIQADESSWTVFGVGETQVHTVAGDRIAVDVGPTPLVVTPEISIQ